MATDINHEPTFPNDDHSRFAGPDYVSTADERIAVEARARVGNNIRVRVHDGVLFLTGSVPDRNAKNEVERSLYDISGVKDILNGLTLERIPHH